MIKIIPLNLPRETRKKSTKTWEKLAAFFIPRRSPPEKHLPFLKKCLISRSIGRCLSSFAYFHLNNLFVNQFRSEILFWIIFFIFASRFSKHCGIAYILYLKQCALFRHFPRLFWHTASLASNRKKLKMVLNDHLWSFLSLSLSQLIITLLLSYYIFIFWLNAVLLLFHKNFFLSGSFPMQLERSFSWRIKKNVPCSMLLSLIEVTWMTMQQNQWYIYSFFQFRSKWLQALLTCHSLKVSGKKKFHSSEKEFVFL